MEDEEVGAGEEGEEKEEEGAGSSEEGGGIISSNMCLYCSFSSRVLPDPSHAATQGMQHTYHQDRSRTIHAAERRLFKKGKEQV